MKKKYLLIFTIFISMLGITSVHAENQSNVITITDYYRRFDLLPDIVSTYSSEINQLIDNFELSSVGSTYNYYYIAYSHNDTILDQDWLLLFPTTDNRTNLNFAPNLSFNKVRNNQNVELWFRYNITTNTFDDNLNYDKGNMPLWPSIPILTNVDYIFYDTTYDKLVIPSYTNNSLDISFPSYELLHNDIIPTYNSLMNGYGDNYLQVSVNNYAYIILSLRDYNQTSFWTNIYVQGRLCLTPVYNYGMTPRNEILVGTQIQSCTTLYNDLSPVNVSIIQSDIDNHAVYYISAYNNEPTTIQYNGDVFDITYVSQEDAETPQVLIAGRSYPVIPYSQLTDSAVISTDNNYISGQVCAVGDVNCNANSIGLDISDLWTAPLQLFKTIGSSIASVMVVISAFITMLPTTLQMFLYTSFFLVIILGIIKVIL